MDSVLYDFCAKIFPKKKQRDAISEMSIKIINPLIDEKEVLPIWERLLHDVFGEKKEFHFTTNRPRTPEEVLLSSEEKEERIRLWNRTIKAIRENGIESFFESLPDYLRRFIEEYYWKGNSSLSANIKARYTKRTEAEYRSELLREDKTFNTLFVDVVMMEVGGCSGWDTCENQEYYAGLLVESNEGAKGKDAVYSAKKH